MRRYKMLLLAVTVLMLGPTAQAADPVAYTVNFTASGDKELDGLLKETSSLVSLQKKLPPAPFALIGRARADVKQFTVVLHSLGYDAGSVGITVDGEALDNPALLDKLTQAPADKPVTVQVVPHQGKLFLLGHVGIAGLPAGFKPPLDRETRPASARRANSCRHTHAAHRFAQCRLCLCHGERTTGRGTAKHGPARCDLHRHAGSAREYRAGCLFRPHPHQGGFPAQAYRAEARPAIFRNGIGEGTGFVARVSACSPPSPRCRRNT